jgi:hypothetical protein
MATRMQQRRGTAAQWTSADPILAAGEIGFETDTSQFKIGDGTNHWADLSYFKNLEDLGGTLDDYIPLSQKNADNGVATLDADGYIPLSQLGNIIGDAPEILDTIAEVAAAINDANGIVSTKITEAVEAEGISRNNAIEDAVEEEAVARAQAISTAVGNHSNDTTSVHGIADTSALATNTSVGTAVSDHNSDTTNVHGISDTSALVTLTGTQTLSGKTISEVDNTITIKVANISDVTASSTELNILDGVTVSAAKINYLSGLTDPIQDQLDAKAPKADPTFTGTATANNLSITGNLTVGGTTTTVNATDLSITDPLIYMSSGNWTTDIVDIGFLAATGEAGGTEEDHKHSGLFRDVSDSAKWKLVSNVPHPVSNTVDLTDAEYDTLKVGGIEYADGVQVKQGVPSLTAITVNTANNYTLSLTDRDSIIEMNSNGNGYVIIPNDTDVDFPVGTSVDILKTSGSGTLGIQGYTGGSGNVTVNATPGLNFRTQWSSATLLKRGPNLWVAFGDLSA